jgi:hypothetical protein
VTLLSLSRVGKPKKRKAVIWVGFSGLFFLVAAAHFVHPSLIKYSLGLGAENIDYKTLQHVRQIAVYYMASALQLLSLALGVRPERAAGLVPLVWSLCFTYMWIIVHISEVFGMYISCFQKHQYIVSDLVRIAGGRNFIQVTTR